MTRTYFKTREAGGDQWYYFSVNKEFSHAEKVVKDLACRISSANYELEQVTEEEYLTSFRTFSRFQDFNKVMEGSDDKNRWIQVGCDNFKSLYFSTSREVMEAVKLVMEYTSNNMAGPDGAREVIRYLKKKVAARKKFEDKLKAAEITAQGPALDPSED